MARGSRSLKGGTHARLDCVCRRTANIDQARPTRAPFLERIVKERRKGEALEMDRRTPMSGDAALPNGESEKSGEK